LAVGSWQKRSVETGKRGSEEEKKTDGQTVSESGAAVFFFKDFNRLFYFRERTFKVAVSPGPLNITG
jgi:hypothetical protein